ncbi:hypothetical protein RJT34_10630 [Clitoria ternatea]|uniref:Glycosyltransferase n=1 Tax=Clitoria ternatea TaxID=43366 RepID=A0AAN9JIJ6_CLITE
MKKEAQLVMIPLSAMGHLASSIEFAKLLTNHDHRLSITILVIKHPHDDDAARISSYTRSLSSSQRVHVINLPECPLDPETPSSFQFQALVDNQKPNVRQIVSNLSGPPLAAFVVDMFCTSMIDVAKEFKVPSLVFYTSGAAYLSLMLHLHTLREQDNLDRSESKEFVIPGFLNRVPRTALPSIVSKEVWDSFFMANGRGLKKADGIIVNSFEELESHAVHSFSNSPIPIYPVGPILNTSANNNINTEILEWLDQQPRSSVVFLCFGSMGSFGEDQVKEIANALENSGVRFLWSLRKPPIRGPGKPIFAPPSDYSVSELAAALPAGFLDRTAGIGKVIGWAPQTQVLAHQATGGFVSHCGWNSTLESIYCGVPIAAWPLYAEQQTNAFELVCELKMAVEVALDYMDDFISAPNFLVTADRIEKGIRSVMEIDEETRKKVKEMSEKSRSTLSEGGCSYSYLGRLIDYIMEQV